MGAADNVAPILVLAGIDLLLETHLLVFVVDIIDETFGIFALFGVNFARFLQVGQCLLIDRLQHGDELRSSGSGIVNNDFAGLVVIHATQVVVSIGIVV